jgi:hypothetical protein
VLIWFLLVVAVAGVLFCSGFCVVGGGGGGKGAGAIFQKMERVGVTISLFAKKFLNLVWGKGCVGLKGNVTYAVISSTEWGYDFQKCGF